MNQDPITGIEILDETVSYADTSEDAVLETLEKAVDRSAGSDELAQAVTDWPSLYHFSRLRGAIVSPLSLRSDHRVLEIGCGSGAVTRTLAESGASVVGLEGSLHRARAAHVRCRELDNVEIICGSLQAYTDDEGFDVVVVVGVLEYSASFIDDDNPFEAFLSHVRRLCRPDGVLLLAIENPIGIKYLLGWPEDHLGSSWSSVEGYPDRSFVETFSRPRLRKMLADGGFGRQRWYFPFPDYKLPTTILSHEIYEIDSAPRIVDQLVRSPVADGSRPATTVAEPRFSHRQLVDAGLGPDVANSFLVIAGAQQESLDELAPSENIAWILSRERLRAWMRVQKVVRRHDSLRLQGFPVEDHPVRERGWLSQTPELDETFFLGETCEQRILEAVRGLQWQELLEALRQWWSVIESATEARKKHTTSPQHPFDDPESPRQLPANWIDIHPSNFVLVGDDCHYIDSEWSAVCGVDPTRAGLRALWYLATELIASGLPLPWPAQTTANEIWATFAQNLDLPADRSSLQALIDAETEMQVLVTGQDAASVRKSLEWLGSRSRTSPEIRAILPFTALDRRIRDLEGRLRQAEQESTALESERSDNAALRRRIADLEDQVQAAESVKATLESEHLDNATLRRRVEDLEARNTEFVEISARLEGMTAELREAENTLKATQGQLVEASERADQADRKARERSAREKVAQQLKERAEHEAQRALNRLAEMQRRAEAADDRIVRAEDEAARARAVAEQALAQRDRSVRRSIRRVGEAQRQAAAAVHQADAYQRELESLRRRLDLRLESLQRTAAEELDEQRLESQQQIDEMQQELAGCQLKAAEDLERQHLESERHLAEAARRIDNQQSYIDQLESENAMWRAWREAFDNRSAVRIYRAIQGLFGKA